MYAWGSTVNGELGVGGVEEEHIFTPMLLKWEGAKNVKQAACGQNHTVLLTEDGKLYSCGSNDHGQLGHDQPRKRPRMSFIKEVHGVASEIVSIACGSSHSLALNQWGQVYTWGSDSSGQLGHGTHGNIQAVPKLIKALASYHIVQIASGLQHSVALTNSGEIFSWGANKFGQLGIGTKSSLESNPTIVASLAGIPIALIACGGYHTFVISKSGAVFGWGRNTSGQLGLNDYDSKTYPCQLRTLRSLGIRYISCGEEFSTFLTRDGGVFTCGAGMYGQLGHGSNANEIFPRKVSELMGSTITQVQCGRQHTLAFIPSRGRIYSFGLGGSGQLGRKKPGNASTPQIVLGPWVSGPPSSVIEENYIVQRIFAGGNHCFAKVVANEGLDVQYDSRILQPETQMVKIDVGFLQSCLNLSDNNTVDQDMITYLETVFKSLACINGSFLSLSDEHVCCTSKHHCLTLEAAEEAFTLIGRIENVAVKEIIWNCITQDLLSKLSPSPPDVETLRIYLILPFYHEFNNPKQHLKLHKPFALALLSLKMQASRVVRGWWAMLPQEYFEHLIYKFKNVASYLIRSQNVQGQQTVAYDPSLSAVLEVLALLNRVSHSVEGLKVPYDVFNITDLTELLDVRADYLRWLTDSKTRFYLCNYPFIFDAQAKTQLLETDQAIQMQTAINAAAQQAILSLLMSHQNVHEINQYLALNVSRDNIVEDTLRELSYIKQEDLKKPIKVEFSDEEAEDAGGVRKEFFLLLLREILDPKYGMFKEYEETRAIWFSEDSFEDELMYLLIGQICGLAIYNFTIIDIPFPLALYKKLLKEPIVLADLKALSPTMANSLQTLLDYKGDDIVETFGLTFEINRDVFGEIRVFELKTNGQNIPVTHDNKQEYVNLYVDYIFNASVSKHYEAFHTGFMKVCGGRVLELFHSYELMAVVIGNENYDWHALEEAAEYKNGYRSSDQVIRWFWEVLHEMPLVEKRKFLQFLTGSDRIPIQGMKAIKIIIQPTHNEKYLPVAHTCFNLLDLPRYKTKERLKYKLIQAIQQTEGFSLV